MTDTKELQTLQALAALAGCELTTYFRLDLPSKGVLWLPTLADVEFALDTLATAPVVPTACACMGVK